MSMDVHWLGRCIVGLEDGASKVPNVLSRTYLQDNCYPLDLPHVSERKMLEHFELLTHVFTSKVF